MPRLGPGRYAVTVASHELCRTRNGKPYISVLFDCQDGHIDWSGWLTDAAMEYTLKTLRTCGWNATEHNGRLDALHGTDILVGNRVEITVEDEEYDGKVRAKVQWVNPLSRMEPDDAERTAAHLADQVLAAEGSQGHPPPQMKEEMDDIPF